MIAKNIKGSSFSGCINYVSKEDSELLKAEGVFAENTKSMIESFEMQRSMRAEIKQPVGHIPISFAPEDREKMSNEFMVKLAEEYMEKMGITNTQYVIIRHHDTENEHVHVVYNRIDNDLKLISVHNDYKRNVATCKELKEKYNLTFGKDKSRVKREKLHGSEAVKYAIHDIVKENLATCKDITELKIALYSSGVGMNLKCKRGSNEVQGVSFSMNGHKFKASQIDRKFSYKNLLLQLRANKVTQGIKERSKLFDTIVDETLKDKQRVTKQTPPRPKPQPTIAPPPPPKPQITIYGTPLTEKQRYFFERGKSVYVRDMTDLVGRKFSGFVTHIDGKIEIQNIPEKLNNVNLTATQVLDLRDGKPICIQDFVGDSGTRYDTMWVKFSAELSRIQLFRTNPDLPRETTNNIGQQHTQSLRMQPSPQPQHEEQHTQSHSHDSDSSGVLSIFDMPSSSSGADQDDIDNAEMAKNLQQKKKRGRRM